MKPFIQHTGLVAPLDRVNVDTDQMIPKQFCKLLTRDGYGKFLFHDWRYLPDGQPNPAFVLNEARYRGASILLTRANFACGSSREHAAWGVLDYGFRAVVAPSFGDIFYNNCFKNGILPVRLPDAAMDELFRRAESRAGYQLTADLPSQTVHDADGLRFSFEMDAARKEILLKGRDDIATTLQHSDAIASFEASRKPTATMYEPVDVFIANGKQ